MFDKQKSSHPDFYLSYIQSALKRIENEQVHQRKDLSVINALLKTLMSDIGTQRQVDDYFESHETSPQTDEDNKRDDEG